MVKITVKTDKSEKTGLFEPGVTLGDALMALGFEQDRPCGGRGLCGKCKVRLNGREVLACQTKIETDAQVDYTTFVAVPASAARRPRFLLRKNPKLHDTTFAAVPASAARRPGFLRGKNPKFHYTTGAPAVQGVTAGAMDAFEGQPLVEDGYGLAVDVGTTTIAGYLYRFPEGKCVRSLAVPNTQAAFGADVISRIDYANGGGLKALQDRVRGQIRLLAGDAPVQKYVITGNTTMLHLLTGLDPRGLAVAPFHPQSLFGDWHGPAYLPRCVSAYVGADITTAILSSGLLRSRTALLADIGTNGEMALWHEGRLLCCSTAAGPAFEGAGIRQGMLAAPGAIDAVTARDGAAVYHTLGGEPPRGLCGTGLIDAVACMLELGALEEDGYLDEDFPIGDSGVAVCPQDIRQVQLAKAAVRAGLDTLLQTAGIGYEQVERFCIAGGFGSYINPFTAARIGLIPWALVPKAQALGNSAGMGAAMILQSRSCLAESERIARMAEPLELATNPVFTEKFIENMAFEPVF